MFSSQAGRFCLLVLGSSLSFSRLCCAGKPASCSTCRTWQRLRNKPLPMSQPALPCSKVIQIAFGPAPPITFTPCVRGQAKVAISFPLSRSQSRSVRSTEAETARRPSGVTATALTQFVWPSSGRIVWPLSRSQSRSVRSSEAETARRPSGVTATALTQFVWPSRGHSDWPLSRSNTRRIPNRPLNKSLLRSGCCLIFWSFDKSHPRIRLIPFAGQSMWSRKARRPCGAAKTPKSYWIQSQKIPVSGLRDRALIAAMLYSFARVSAVLKLKVDEYYHNGARRRLRLHEKGGKEHEMPVHHLLEQILDVVVASVTRISARSRCTFDPVYAVRHTFRFPTKPQRILHSPSPTRAVFAPHTFRPLNA